MKVWVAAVISACMISAVAGCNNPFSTRDPEPPDSVGGAGIKPPDTAENVLYNLRASFESISSQEYLSTFGEDFSFHPDPDDSIKYEEEFRGGWGMDKETVFAQNFLHPSVVSEIELYPTYEYKPGEDMYEYTYSMKVFSADSTQVIPYDVEGRAWLYLRENNDGEWHIHRWVEITNTVGDAFITWGVLRARNL